MTSLNNPKCATVRTISWTICVIALGLCVSSLSLSQTTPPPAVNRTPVLVELFTSEGCSTCPPADHFLEALDGQPIPGTEIIVLSEHVDYWDHLGWKDPFSSREVTERQETYVHQFKLASAYTPQMIVDGGHQFSGVNAKQAAEALREAATRRKTAVEITNVFVESSRVHARVECTASKSADVPTVLDVYVALALSHAENQVTAGENASRHLTHTAVVRKLARVGKLKAGEPFSRDVEFKVEDKNASDNLRVITFLQDPSSGRVFGAAMQKLTSTKH